ncbi:YciI family protein [soil metagenome]
MLYAIFCYDAEDVIGAWTTTEDAAVMARLRTVEQGLAAEGRLGPTARLLPTTTAVTLRKGREGLVIDGPFAETREQLLGFYVVDCDGLEAAIDTARRLSAANRGGGAYEIRPIGLYRPAIESAPVGALPAGHSRQARA